MLILNGETEAISVSVSHPLTVSVEGVVFICYSRVCFCHQKTTQTEASPETPRLWVYLGPSEAYEQTSKNTFSSHTQILKEGKSLDWQNFFRLTKCRSPVMYRVITTRWRYGTGMLLILRVTALIHLPRWEHGSAEGCRPTLCLGVLLVSQATQNTFC